MSALANLIFNPVVFPKKEIVASCSLCGHEVARRGWEHYTEYNRQVEKLTAYLEECPNCRARFKDSAKKVVIPWERTNDGDYIAKAKNGDFLVWKYGYGYKWRYRKYGAETQERINFAKTKDEAKRACERHVEWVI